MIEVRIPLSLPIRKVVPAERGAAVPEWLRAEFARRTDPSLARGRNTLSSSLTAGSVEPRSLVQEREALQQERANLARGLIQLQQVTRCSEEQLSGLMSEVREATIELAHAIAAKLIFEQIERDRFPIENLVHEVLARLPTREAAIIRLHPADLALLEELPAIRGSGAEGERSLQYVADATLARGDCRATAGEIKVVYELRHQIEEIRRQLLSTVSGHDEVGP